MLSFTFYDARTIILTLMYLTCKLTTCMVACIYPEVKPLIMYYPHPALQDCPGQANLHHSASNIVK
jgi:hypothetical protein